MARFQTVKQRARFNYSGFSIDAMQRIAEATRESVRARIQDRAENVNDQPARSLKSETDRKKRARSYLVRKVRKGTPPHGNKAVRNWTFTGHTMAQMRVLSVSVNKAKIGFVDATRPQGQLSARRIAAILNSHERQFGMSPKNYRDLENAVRDEVRRDSPLKAQQVA